MTLAKRIEHASHPQAAKLRERYRKGVIMMDTRVGSSRHLWNQVLAEQVSEDDRYLLFIAGSPTLSWT